MEYSKKQLTRRVRFVLLLTSLFWLLVLLAFSTYYTKRVEEQAKVIKQFIPIVQSVPELQANLDHYKERARILNEAHNSASSDRSELRERVAIYETRERVHNYNYGRCLAANTAIQLELQNLLERQSGENHD